MAAKTFVVIPFFCESSGAIELLQEIEASLLAPTHFILVDDGSTDDTLAYLKRFMPGRGNSRSIISLSRNFGHQPALMAGICAVPPDADRVVTLDGDFQDSPADIPKLLAKLDEGFDCAYATRAANSGSRLTNLLSSLFYIILQKTVSFFVPRNAGAFCAFNNKILKALQSFPEADGYFPGLRAYVGFRQTPVLVSRDKRRHGNSRVGFLGLCRLAMSGIFSFSPAPVRFIFFIGLVVFALCSVLGLFILGLRLMNLLPPQGFTSLALLILGLAGLQTMFIGIVGEFLGKTFVETKRRPRWFIQERFDD